MGVQLAVGFVQVSSLQSYCLCGSCRRWFTVEKIDLLQHPGRQPGLHRRHLHGGMPPLAVLRMH